MDLISAMIRIHSFLASPFIHAGQSGVSDGNSGSALFRRCGSLAKSPCRIFKAVGFRGLPIF
jgi:hypothetical protein